MVLPVVMGAIAVGSALAQYLNSEAGRRLSAEEREKLEQLLKDTKKPNFDMSKIEPRTLQVVGTYTPEIANYIKEEAPKLTKADSEGAVKGRQAQIAALERLKNLSNTGVDELTEMERTSAMNDVMRRNRGSVGAVSENFAQRGQAGGAKELLAQMFNAQEQNDQQAQVGAKFAIEAQRRKLQSLMDSANLGGQIRGEDVQLESRNNDILNQFNQRYSNDRQNWENNRANALNDAQKYNIGNVQRVADGNVGILNDADKYNQSNQNNLKQRDYDNEMDKVRALAGVTTMARNDINSNTAANNNAISGASGAVIGGMSKYYSDNGSGKQQSAPVKEEPAYNPQSYKPEYESVTDDESEYETSKSNPLRRDYR